MLSLLGNLQTADTNFFKILVAGIISGTLIFSTASLMTKRVLKYGIMGPSRAIVIGQIFLVVASLIVLIPYGYLESWVIALALFIIWTVLVTTCTVWVLTHVFFVYLYVHTHRVVERNKSKRNQEQQ